MSRTSPGRYALHEFSKNVYDVVVTDGAGRPLDGQPAEPAPVGRCRSRRRRSRAVSRLRRPRRHILSIDATHAHINMPAAFMWARGLDRRPAQVPFERPAGTSWSVATRCSHGEPACLHGAQPPVPAGPPLRVRPWRARDLRRRWPPATRRRRRRFASPSITRARPLKSRPSSTAFAASSSRRGECSASPGVREQHLHVSGRLPAVGQRRRHGAP